MRPSFTPPPLLFWAYVALSILSVVLVEISDEGDAVWWGLLISLALLYGLYRGLELAWWLLFIFDAWTLVAGWAIQPEGDIGGDVLAVAAVLVLQLAVLLAIRFKTRDAPGT